MHLSQQVKSPVSIFATQVQPPADLREFDFDAARSWLDLLHGNSPGLLHVCAVGNWNGRTFSDPADAANYVARLDAEGREGIYLRNTTLSGLPKDANGRVVRGGAEWSLALPGFAADIDLDGPGHKHDPDKHAGRMLPPDIPTAINIVEESGLPEPTLWVHSGGGLYPWWLFEDVYLTDTPEKLKAAEKVSAQLQSILHRTAARLGWHYGGEVGDLARVLRIPGTVNRKAGGAQTAQVLEPAAYEFYDFDALEERVGEIHAALPPVEAPRPANVPRVLTRSDDISPGDDFELRTHWADILVPAGWEYMYSRGRTMYWKRPGKTTPGHSATTGRAADRDRLYAFSAEAAPFEANTPYTKFAAYTLLNHNGDFAAAASALRAQGFGGQISDPKPLTDLRELVKPKSEVDVAGVDVEPVPALEPVPQIDSTPSAGYLSTDVGNATRMRNMFHGSFKKSKEQNCWYEWTGKTWQIDMTEAVNRAAVAVSEQILAEAQQLQEVDEKKGDKLYKWGLASQMDGKLKATINQFAAQPGITVGASAFDAHRELITMGNGVFNLKTGELSPFNPSLLLTRRFNANFAADATCPQFEAFMAKLLPDAEVRDYVQRAMGYTLMGSVDQRAIFILYGPPRTGKSQFLNIMRGLFGDFGGTAAAAALRSSKSAQTNDLHGLRGKRFISTSETSEGTTLDEEVIKRLTGQDAIVSRDLYEKNQEWTPECTIWMATNTKPNLSADDPAIWTRVKPVLFGTQFSPEPGAVNKEVPGIWEKILEAEASGIFNWLLEGMRKYQESGLPEPKTVKESVAEYKLESDTVAQFIADGIAEGIIIEDPAETISSGHLFRIYQEWCGRNMIRPLGAKKVVRRLSDLGYNRKRISTWHWIGLKPGVSAGLLGTM